MALEGVEERAAWGMGGLEYTFAEKPNRLGSRPDTKTRGRERARRPLRGLGSHSVTANLAQAPAAARMTPRSGHRAGTQARM